jgi:6-phosphofructokinase 1
MIMEVMGRDAGWIALHTAIAGGAEVCLIPEIPYDVQKIVRRINMRYKNGRGFVNLVVSEGAKPKDGTVTASAGEKGSEHVRLGGVAYQLSRQLKEAGCTAEIRETVLGHVQRGGSPMAFDRVLASLFGVYAFELVLKKDFGRMVSYKNNSVSSVTLKEATKEPSFVDKNSYIVKAAKGLGISFGD